MVSEAGAGHRLEVAPRADGWWQLRVIVGGIEVGGGIYPPTNEGWCEAMDTAYDWLRPRASEELHA